MDIIQRVKDITLKPKDTWRVIKEEPATINDLYTSYAVPLAAISPIASFLGMSLFGFSAMGFHYRVSLGTGIGHALVSYVLTLASLYAIALIIDALAPNFGSQKNLVNAMKVAVYSWTPSWVAGILLIIPALAPIVMLISLYSLYVLYLGLPIQMETPPEKVLGYFIATIVVCIIAFILIGVLSNTLFGVGRIK